MGGNACRQPMSEPPITPSTQPAALDWVLALRWPVALVAAVGIGAAFLGRVLQGPIKIELVMASPLPVAGQVDVGSIKTPLAVDRISSPISTTPIQTAPIFGRVTLADPVRVVSPLSVNVPALNQAIGVEVKSPVEATVKGVVKTQVDGEVNARLLGDVNTTINGGVNATVFHPPGQRRIRIGF